jgi:single-stranded DNA-binding protein
MLLPEQKFLVEQVNEPEITKDRRNTMQRIILNKPGYTDEFGEKVGKDDHFECKAWNKTIESVPVLKPGDKVAAMLNLQGSEFIDDHGKKSYSAQLTIRKIVKV